MITREFNFVNGNKVKEKITGFEGIITGTCFYITGCNQYLVTSESLDSSTKPTSLWYDEGRLILIDEGYNEDDFSTEENGCDIIPDIGSKGF